MDSFKQRAIVFIQKVPKGKVVSYGQVAAIAGSPRAARQVGGILRTLEGTVIKVPWWRVVNGKGEISIKGNWTATKELQAALLRKDGVKVEKDLTLDIEKYRFKN